MGLARVACPHCGSPVTYNTGKRRLEALWGLEVRRYLCVKVCHRTHMRDAGTGRVVKVPADWTRKKEGSTRSKIQNQWPPRSRYKKMVSGSPKQRKHKAPIDTVAALCLRFGIDPDALTAGPGARLSVTLLTDADVGHLSPEDADLWLLIQRELLAIRAIADELRRDARAKARNLKKEAGA